MIKLGGFSSRRYLTLSWKEFKQSEYFPTFKENLENELSKGGKVCFPIERILKGGKYPSVAIIFDVTSLLDTKDVVRVKLSVQKDKFKEILKGLGINKLVDFNGVLNFCFEQTENGIDYGVDARSCSDDVRCCYIDRGQYYELLYNCVDEDDLDNLDI